MAISFAAGLISMLKLPKLLLISPVLPDREREGRCMRLHAWIERLYRDYCIHLLVITTEKLTWSNDSRLANIRVLQLIGPPRKRWQLLAGALFCGPATRRWLDDWFICGEREQAMLGDWFANMRFERILVFRLVLIEFGDWLRRFTRAERLDLDIDDFESLTRASIARLYWRNRRWLGSLYRHATAAQYARLERRYLPICNKVFACTNEDAERLASHRGARVTEVVVNRIAGPIADTAPLPLNTRILFIGALGYFPNEDAVRFFANKVLPKLDDLAATFAIVGRGASDSLQVEIVRQTAVEWVGEVDSTAEWYARARIVVAPLRAGGGTKLKVLEAFKYGRPLVATGEAVRGLDVQDGVHYLRAETASEFADACRRVLVDTSLCQRLVLEARQFLAQGFLA